MTTSIATKRVTREGVLSHLTDDELVHLHLAEATHHRLGDGEEFVDFDRLQQGVRRVHGTMVPMGRVVPRKAVSEQAWNKIVAALAPKPRAAPPRAARVTTTLRTRADRIASRIYAAAGRANCVN